MKKEITKLNFENFIWLLFISLSILNINGNNFEKDYLKTKNNIYKTYSNDIYNLVIKVSILIYLYFFIRNYKEYEKSNTKELYIIKLLGSTLFLSGILCLYYFQNKQKKFIGSPGI